MGRFSNRVVLVTGGVSGIGLAISTAFAQQGADLILGGMMAASAAETLCAELVAKGAVACRFDDTDLRDGAAARAFVSRAEQNKGAIDVLVNNAGIQHVAPIEDFPTDKWDDILAVNLSAAFHTTAAALPAMRGTGFGRVVNMASAHGLVASVHKSAYVAAKHGIVGLTKAVALETADTDITCNAVCPGFVLTPLVAEQVRAHQEKTGLDFDKAGLDLIKDKHPTGRFVTQQQIADMVLFLADKNAGAITGTTMSVDGGWTAQ